MTTTAHDLIEQMLQAGEWPEPELLERILEQGEDAVEPLRDVLRRDLRGWPDEAALTFAISLLSDLRSEATIPDLVNVLRRGYDDLLDGIGDELGRFGRAVIAPLLEIVQDRSLDWYPRAVAIDGVLAAAGSDVGQRAAIAEVLRAELSHYLELTEQDPNDDLPTFLVCGLTDLADPLARDLLAGAFAAGLVDQNTIDERYVDELYARGGRFHETPPGRSIDDYKRQYAKERETAEEDEAPSEEFRRQWESAKRSVMAELGEQLPESATQTEPIRRPAFRPGRNDPCWCGSGKKYKKCHLASDEASGV